jgi:hypothetical protein
MLIEPHQLRWIEDKLIVNDIDFVIIGGVAVRYYCPERQAGDLEMFVGADAGVVDRIVAAIPRLERDVTARGKLLDPKVGHFRVEGPHAIDVLTFARGLSLEEALRTAERHEQQGTVLSILSRSLLIAHKQSVGERKDIMDVALLRSGGH